jgi:uncharacterized membrane protein
MGRLTGIWPRTVSITSRRCTVIAAMVAVSLAVGFAVGWVLTMVLNSAAMSHSQERMERRVRYWQAETAQARDKAERLARAVGLPADLPPEGGGWPEMP